MNLIKNYAILTFLVSMFAQKVFHYMQISQLQKRNMKVKGL